MKSVFFIAAIILAGIATFLVYETTAANGRNWRINFNFFAGAFLCWLLSQAPFIS